MSESLKELSAAMNNLSVRLENTSMCAASGQRAGDVSLRRIYVQEEANSNQRTEATARAIENGQPTNSGHQP